eukprot:gb/GFBE01023648.1/.p1 GENE.gb/GFBE01023648.1/~~gb/GFBE01023648.1/.p1  ORF type:complete len:326 (+),score=35.94 gb/GFBE01023648.1/:1-978(+)
MSASSPRLGMTSPRSSGAMRSPRPTLSNFGSLLPRPSASGQQAGASMRSPRMSEGSRQQKGSASGTSSSSRQRPETEATPSFSSSASGFFGIGGFFSGSSSPRGERPAPPTSLRKALGTRGGVVRAQDGFEVFYGVGEDDSKPKTRQSARPKQDSRDGFDKFYGIQSRQRDGDHASSSTAHVGGASEERRQLETQLQSRLGSSTTGAGTMLEACQDAAGESNSARSAGAAAASGSPGSKPKVPSLNLSARPGGGYPGESDVREKHQVPAGVPMFSLDAQPALPRGVETFSMCGRSAQSPRLSQQSAATYSIASQGGPRAAPAVRG